MSRRNREKRNSPRNERRGYTLVYFKARTDFTDDEMQDMLRQTRQARKDYPRTVVLCVIEGYDDDARELGEIPEVRHLCQRLIDLGVCKVLERSVAICPPVDDPVFRVMMAGLGAFEVWLIAKGKVQRAGPYQIDHAWLGEFTKEIGLGDERWN